MLKSLPTRGYKILAITFFVLILLVIGQVAWWMLFQVRQTNLIVHQMTELGERTKYVVAAQIESIVRNPLYEDSLIIGQVRMQLDGNILSNYGDTSGFSVVISNWKNQNFDFHYVGQWGKRQENTTTFIYQKYQLSKIFQWASYHFPDLEIGSFPDFPRFQMIPAGYLKISEVYANQIEETGYRWFRMFMSEGLFFIVVILLGAWFIITRLKKEWLITHQTQNFMLSVTHELKSPIAGVKLNLETMIRHQLSREEQLNFIQKSVTDIHRLEEHVENILDAAKLEEGGVSFPVTEINMTELIEKVFTSGRYKDDVRIELHESIKQDVWVVGNERACISIFTNLVDNALKYSDKHIHIRLKDDGNYWAVSIKDFGNGIPQSAQPYIFNKFFRVDNELTRSSKGVGLGLYIVEKFVKLHQGDISVHSEIGKGSEFIVKIPKMKEDLL